MIYNHSGKEQQIQVPMQATGVANRCCEQYHQHITPRPGFRRGDLRKVSTSPADVNSGGRVNIFDRVAIANAFE